MTVRSPDLAQGLHAPAPVVRTRSPDPPDGRPAPDSAGRRQAASLASGTAVERPRSGRPRRVKNGVATVVMWSAFGVALVPLVSIVVTVTSAGWRPLLTAAWWTSDQTGALPPGFDHEVRGALHAIVGTVLMSLLTALIAIPVGVLTAIYLVEYGRGRSALARAVGFVVDILAGVPSIVAALFVFAVWVGVLRLRLVPAAASLALVLLMIPVITRSTEEMLKLVPDELREASYALGITRARTILRIVVPTALPGIVTGSLLGFARVAGETAPLLILAAYTGFFNADLLSGSMAALPTLINSSYQQMGDPVVARRVWGGALTLILLIGALNLIARLLSRLARRNR